MEENVYELTPFSSSKQAKWLPINQQYKLVNKSQIAF